MHPRWHYILTGPPNTPYEGGQYWGSLMFPSDYPFAPPAIRMHTPSGRFQPSTRLCLSISDFHPKSFNPAWSVSTILIGLMSFMTSEEMTTGSMGASETERRLLAARSRWWNSTGGGSATKPTPGVHPTSKGVGNIKAGDGGVKFRFEWPDVDAENWEWVKENRIDPATGRILPDATGTILHCSPEAAALRRQLGGSAGFGNVVHEGRAARDAGQSWLRRNKFWVAAGLVFTWVLLARVFGEGLDL
jgi:ubiquitin-conjugating enzyme E2 J2